MVLPPAAHPVVGMALLSSDHRPLRTRARTFPQRTTMGPGQLGGQPAGRKERRGPGPLSPGPSVPPSLCRAGQSSELGQGAAVNRQKAPLWAYLVVQWLGVHSAMQGTWFDPWSGRIPCVADQLSPCAVTTGPVPQSLGTAAAEARGPRACVPQQENPPHREAYCSVAQSCPTLRPHGLQHAVRHHVLHHPPELAQTH